MGIVQFREAIGEHVRKW